MSDAFTITISGLGEAQSRFQKFGNSPGLSKVMGEAAQKVTRDWLFRLDGERANTLGGRRSHFYADAAKNTRYEATDDGATVVITKTGLRQRWLGGTITAKNVKFLTIPARSESYGVPARQFPRKLRFVQFRSGAAALVIDDRGESTTHTDDAGNVTTRRGKRNKRMKTAGIVEYWLVPSVHQNPDPSVLPSQSVLTEAVVEAGKNFLMRFQD